MPFTAPATRPDLHDAFGPPFAVLRPERRRVPFVFSVPHAGDVYPPAFLAMSQLAPTALRRSEDAFVDRLFGGVVALGAPLLAARFPRAYLDVNREPYELDPRMFEGRLPPFANTRSVRVAAGLGTVPRIVADGHEVYRGRIPVEDALARVADLYVPYHDALAGLLAETDDLFGHAVLIDCHSMPSAPGRDGTERADVVLGDRFGASCSPLLTTVAEAAFRERGYRVVRNKPYAGGYITEHYGAPALDRHALQIEIRRSLYMDERALRPTAGFAALAGDLAIAFEAVMSDLGGDLAPRRVAAE